MDELTRRAFLAGALAAGASVTVPLPLLARAATMATPAGAGGRYLTAPERLTCDAICSRIVPTDADPGGHEAAAVDFIDLFLSAFELPPSVADNPGIYIHGRFSGRNPYPDPRTGQPSTRRPKSDFVDTATGVRHFQPLNRRLAMSWRATLYGASVLVKDTSLPKGYRDAVAAGLIPVPAVGLRDVYRTGLAAYDSWAHSLGQADFASAPTALQDAMLMTVGNVVLGGVLGALPALPAAPPPAAVALYTPVSVHTFQACFGLPEYGSKGGPPFWAWVGWEGDTQPLGNSIYDETIGGYREYREVSTNHNPGRPLAAADAAHAADALRRARRR